MTGSICSQNKRRIDALDRSLRKLIAMLEVKGQLEPRLVGLLLKEIQYASEGSEEREEVPDSGTRRPISEKQFWDGGGRGRSSE